MCRINLLDVSSTNYGTVLPAYLTPTTLLSWQYRCPFQGIRLWKISTWSWAVMLQNPGGSIPTKFCVAWLAYARMLTETYQGNAHGLLRQKTGGRQKETKCEAGDKVHSVSWLCLIFMLSSSDSVVFQKGRFGHSLEGKLVKSKTRRKTKQRLKYDLLSIDFPHFHGWHRAGPKHPLSMCWWWQWVPHEHLLPLDLHPPHWHQSNLIVSPHMRPLRD